MPLDVKRTRRLLEDFQLETIFIEELGWDHHSGSLTVDVGEESFNLSAIAQKRGMTAFRCDPLPDGTVPAYATRRKIERRVAKSAHEHFIVYVDQQRSKQVWQWVKRRPGEPDAGREHTYRVSQRGDAFIQKLRQIQFSLEEEENLNIVDVTSRVRAAFDVEKVTKKFYDRFQKEHEAFLQFIDGIPDEEMERWYASVMLNRLMFIYFIQKKGFLDGDINYLRTKLAESTLRGRNLYYRDFLCPLFFEGFARRESERSEEARRLLGTVPYLNGGIFQRHQVEELHGDTIAIPDEAFEVIFDFFEQYQWHLDERPLRQDNEINPDVLGYIFEKYINQKQMGAYYTKEDITEYISKNTVIPRIFDMAREKCRIAFEGEHSVWDLLAENPDPYIYDAMQEGMDRDLPGDISAGVDDVSRRDDWNVPTPGEYALPTEIWRETVARRQRCEELRRKLNDGEVRSVDDLITLNLDLHQFASDVIVNCEGRDLLKSFWRALQDVTVLDPACGSGAFLFAALNILEPLYERCLDRMEAFLAELEDRPGASGSQKYGDFREILERIDRHPSRRYFILKSIVLNNLYGVDIMEEAVEICKLRLFLKLVAQVDRVEDIEPLPDIDFNVRAGNSLVGFTSKEEVEKAIKSVNDGNRGQTRLMMEEDRQTLREIEERAEVVDRAFGEFQRMQTEKDMDSAEFTSAKKDLRARLQELEAELNRYLANEYGIDLWDDEEYENWLHSHKPFHWFVDFYGIMTGPGFDVVIGNPPWIEYSKVRSTYQVNGYETEACGNLLALFTERSLHIRSAEGNFSFIVQLPLVSSSRMEEARDFLRAHSGTLHVAPFDDRPAKLFNGLQHCRSAIILSHKNETDNEDKTRVARYQRWHSEVRDALFQNIHFLPFRENAIVDGVFPKLDTVIEKNILHKLRQASDHRLQGRLSTHKTEDFVFYQEAMQYWTKATIGLPFYAKDGKEGAPAHGRYLYFADEKACEAAFAVLYSSLFYAYFIAHGDCFHLSHTLATSFPIVDAILNDDAISEIGRELDKELRANAERKTINARGGHRITYSQFDAAKSKPLIDKIDRALGAHYGFTDEELDFIINYDIKYRMGLDTLEEKAE